MAIFSLNRLAIELHALAFADQSVPWPVALADQTTDPSLDEALRDHVAAADRLPTLVAVDLLATTGRPVDLFGPVPNPARLGAVADATTSVGGVAPTQLGTLLDLEHLGYSVAQAKLLIVFSHSQGVLAVYMTRAIEAAGSIEAADTTLDEILAVAVLIGAAGTRHMRELDLNPKYDEVNLILSVKGATRTQVEVLVARVNNARGPISIAVTNPNNHHVPPGYSEDLATFVLGAEREHQCQIELRERKFHGGTVFNPTLEYLEVTLPFHSPLTTGAVEQTAAQAGACGFDQERTRALAEEVLLNYVDWNAHVKALSDDAGPSKSWIVDFGPDNTLGKLIGNVVQGAGIGVIGATMLAERSTLPVLESESERTQNWEVLAPRVINTLTGAKLVTKFPKLTDKPPVLLPGMTPTAVEPGIVAATANAGYWAEFADGGQVTAEIFSRHIAALEDELEGGHTVEFNTTFMDRYLWNLQFGSSRIVPRKRASGAPIDGMVVSADIPELDEAVELIKNLQVDGLPYVSSKPGIVDQIYQIVRITKVVASTIIMIQVEGGEAGDHHSWETLDDLLAATYAEVRTCDNLVLVASGGIGTPERAADYTSGQQAHVHGLPDMLADGVFIGTAAMTAKEAHTSPEVKQLLAKTPGIPADVKSDDMFASQAAHWVPSGKFVDGMPSGLNHLHAGIYEPENDSAEYGRLLVRIMKHLEELYSRRKEIIEALNKAAKSHFGNLASMTYLEWTQRFAKLALPWVDPTYADRFQHLLQCIKARVNDMDSGELTSKLFVADGVSVEEATVAGPLDHDDILVDPASALRKLALAYPQAAELKVTPADVAWFPVFVREYPKPMPFVPVIDNDLLRRWDQDQLWQPEDQRYSADSVRAIPDPIFVADTTAIDEPIADTLGRLETAAIKRVQDEQQAADAAENDDFAALGGATSAEDFIRRSLNISQVGHITDNPAHGTVLGDQHYEIRVFDAAAGKYDLDIHPDTYWDNDPDGGTSKHVVRDIVIPLIVEGAEPGRMSVVDRERLIPDAYVTPAVTTGIGNTITTGDKFTEMSQLGGKTSDERPFATAIAAYILSANLGLDHEATTGAALSTTLQPSRIAPDALVDPAWPAIYTALDSVYVKGYPMIEGLLNTVRFDHLIELKVNEEDLLKHIGETITLKSWAENYLESVSGRVITVHVTHTAADGTLLAREIKRFAIRGRVYPDTLPADAPEFGDAEYEGIVPTPRRLLHCVKAVAPCDMTAFARISGDFNPTHTSTRGARISGLVAPLVYGMWLSAAAQHAVQTLDEKNAHYEIAGWTYNMHGMVQLNDTVEIFVERVGKVCHGGVTLEVTCRIDGQLVPRDTALVCAPRAAFVYPGQGTQKQSMVLDERAKFAAARDVWERADKLTRSKLDFSILDLMHDNPKEFTANGVIYRHPEGLSNLMQLTQVALTTVTFVQTARLREAGADIWPVYFAGHSLGEYNILSTFVGVISLETMLELVLHRGSTMHHLIERNAQGRPNYRMGALRPNQFGVDGVHVKEYVESVAKVSGEFSEIVNYDPAGQQYAIAGTIAGLKVLKADSARHVVALSGKSAFMLVPGIGAPFYSTLPRKSVPKFRDKLDALLPAYTDYRGCLVDHYIPNLVATSFEMAKEFAAEILEVVPSERIKAVLDDPAVWDSYADDDQELGHPLLTELLSWQFASPVCWTETQALPFDQREQGGLGVEEYIEAGLGNAPALANLGAKTLHLSEFAGNDMVVYNVGRDEGRVYMTDTDSLVPDDESEEAAVPAPVEAVPADGSAAAELGSDATPANAVTEVVQTMDGFVAGQSAGLSDLSRDLQSGQAVAGAPSGATVADLPFKVSDVIDVLMAHSAKARIDQTGSNNTADTLTNGVSSRRNQLLMDISSELGVASMDGAVEATLDKLAQIVNKTAPNYKPFDAVLSEALRDRLRSLFSAAGVKQQYIRDRVTNVWQLGEGQVASVLATLLLDTHEGASSRGGDLTKLFTAAVQNKPEVDRLVDVAVEVAAQLKGAAVALPSAGGAAGGAVVDSAALDAFAEKVAGSNDVLAATARFVLNELDVAAPVLEEFEDENTAVVATAEAELGFDQPKQVALRLDANRAILFDDRWASAREDLVRAYYDDNPAALNGSFIGLDKATAAEAQWFVNELGGEELKAAFQKAGSEALEQVTSNKNASRYANDIVIVTGVSPNSIAAQMVEGLFAGGTIVVVTSHSLKSSIKAQAKQAYREHVTGNAKLWLVPASLSSYHDVDVLVDWVGYEQKKTSGATTTIPKPVWEPILFFPLVAPPVHGTPTDFGDPFESQVRLMLWGVERAIAGSGHIGADTNVQHKSHVVLPGSPNRGAFGGNGAYGEVKSASDTTVNRARAEKVWSSHVTFTHPKIG